MTHPIYHIFFLEMMKNDISKKLFFENTCTGFSENLVEDIKLMPNKVLRKFRVDTCRRFYAIERIREGVDVPAGRV